MKKLIVITLCLALGLSFIFGCGKKEEAQSDTQTPAVGHPEETADSTRLDSAPLDTMVVDTVVEEPEVSPEGH